MDTVGAPVVLGNTQARDIAQRRLSRSQQRRLLLSPEPRDEVIHTFVDWQRWVAERILVVRHDACTRDGIEAGAEDDEH